LLEEACTLNSTPSAGQNKDILVLFPREGFPDLEEVGIKEVNKSPAAELTLKNFKWLTLLSGS
jgi:hypothetical protein